MDLQFDKCHFHSYMGKNQKCKYVNYFMYYIITNKTVYAIFVYSDTEQ